jgi:hypothetical protein
VAFPLSAMPTLDEFSTRAKQQGCHEGRANGGIIGPHGPVSTRYLARNNAIAILPNIGGSDRLTATELSHLVRVLDVNGFDHCLSHDAYEDDLDNDDGESS